MDYISSFNAYICKANPMLCEYLGVFNRAILLTAYMQTELNGRGLIGKNKAAKNCA